MKTKEKKCKYCAKLNNCDCYKCKYCGAKMQRKWANEHRLRSWFIRTAHNMEELIAIGAGAQL